MTLMNKASLALALVLAFCVSAFGQTYYADSTAAGGGTGTEASPFNSISQINAVLNAGRQVVKLKAGSTFDSSGGSLDLTNNDTLMKYGFGANPIIDGGAADQCIRLDNGLSQNIFIQDVTLQNGASNNFHCEGMAIDVVLKRVLSQNADSGNGFAHGGVTASAGAAGGTITYLYCTADGNDGDGFSNRGHARDISIGCISTNHTNAASDGWTTHDNSGFEIWYCTSEGNTDGAHFTHGDFGNTYTRIVGSTFKNNTTFQLNMPASEAGLICNSVFEGNTQVLCEANAGSGTTITFECCQFLGVAGGAVEFMIDHSGAGTVIIRNSLIRMPANTTAGSCYGSRGTSSGGLFLYNNSVVIPPDATETANYYGTYKSTGTGSQVVNNVFLKTDEPNAFFMRSDATISTHDLVDGNVYTKVTTNNDSWFNGAARDFSEWQALNKGLGGASTDNSGYDLDHNITGTSADTVGGIGEFMPRPLSFNGYGIGINCITEASITHKFNTAYGQFAVGMRDGSAGGIWVQGPAPRVEGSDGQVSRMGNRVIFNHATINTSWSETYKLVDSRHIKGDSTKRQGLIGLQLQTTSATEIYIHAGERGYGDEMIWTGNTGTVLPLVISFDNEPQWATAGKDLYVTFVGGGVVSGEIRVVEGTVTDNSAVPKMPARASKVVGAK